MFAISLNVMAHAFKMNFNNPISDRGSSESYSEDDDGLPTSRRKRAESVVSIPPPPPPMPVNETKTIVKQ